MGCRTRHRQPIVDSVRLWCLGRCDERESQNESKTNHESHPFFDRARLISVRFFFSSMRRLLAAAGMPVLIRGRSGVSACRSSSEKRSSASARFMSSTSRPLRYDAEDAILVDARCEFPTNLVLLILGKRWGVRDIEGKCNPAADLVYVLSARSSASGRGEGDFAFGNRQTRHNSNHVAIRVTTKANSNFEIRICFSCLRLLVLRSRLHLPVRLDHPVDAGNESRAAPRLLRSPGPVRQ